VCARLKSSQVTQREIAASSRRSRPPKPDPLGRFGQRKQGNAGKGRRRAQTPRVKLEVVLEHAGTPCCAPAGDGISYLREGRLVRLGPGLRPRPWARADA